MGEVLAWWKTAVGLPLPCDDGLVAHWAVPAAGHVPQPKEPIPLRCLFAIARFAQSARGSVELFSKWVLLVLCACLRFAHVQRSCNLHQVGPFLRATCRQGKRRVQHTRPPFDWALPTQLLRLDIGECLLLAHGELTNALGKPPGFLVEDVDVSASRPLQPGAVRLARPMSLGRFATLLRVLAAGDSRGGSHFIIVIFAQEVYANGSRCPLRMPGLQ